MVWLLDTQYGLINKYLNFLGIENVPWLTSTNWVLIGVSIASIWWDLGLAFILFLAGLQDIPKDLIDSSKTDGANPLQRLIHVVVPYMRPVISMVITLQLIATLRIFSQILVMTSGGPAGASSSRYFHIHNCNSEPTIWVFFCCINSSFSHSHFNSINEIRD